MAQPLVTIATGTTLDPAAEAAMTKATVIDDTLAWYAAKVHPECAEAATAEHPGAAAEVPGPPFPPANVNDPTSQPPTEPGRPPGAQAEDDPGA